MIDGKVKPTFKLIGKVGYANIPQIDATLTKEGQCADAKAVGDAIKNVENEYEKDVNRLSDDIAELQTALGTNISEVAELVGGDA